LLIRLSHDEIFMDVHSIFPGADYQQTIANALADSTIILPVIGRSWLTLLDSTGKRRLDNVDDQLHIELTSALAAGKVIIPLLVQGATMPSPSDLPEPLRPLSTFQALTVRPDPDFDNDMRRVREAIMRYNPPLEYHQPVVVSSGAAPPYPRPRQPSSPWSRLFSRRPKNGN
jgi:hypothetical protein